jgi:hypothetical protein
LSSVLRTRTASRGAAIEQRRDGRHPRPQRGIVERQVLDVRRGFARADLALRYRGAIDGIGSDPRFVVVDAEGRRVVDQAVAARVSVPADHEGLLPVLHEWIAGHTDQLRVVAVGHRVVHGGEQFAAPVCSTT